MEKLSCTVMIRGTILLTVSVSFEIFLFHSNKSRSGAYGQDRELRKNDCSPALEFSGTVARAYGNQRNYPPDKIRQYLLVYNRCGRMADDKPYTLQKKPLHYFH